MKNLKKKKIVSNNYTKIHLIKTIPKVKTKILNYRFNIKMDIDDENLSMTEVLNKAFGVTYFCYFCKKSKYHKTENCAQTICFKCGIIGNHHKISVSKGNTCTTCGSRNYK